MKDDSQLFFSIFRIYVSDFCSRVTMEQNKKRVIPVSNKMLEYAILRFASLIYNLRHLRSMFAEELLKIKLACLLAISSFRRFWKHQRRLRPSPVMIAETISSACFVLLVVVFCCVIKIYAMVKSIPLSQNERVRVVYARDNQRALPVAREPTVYFPQAERSAGQHGTYNTQWITSVTATATNAWRALWVTK